MKSSVCTLLELSRNVTSQMKCTSICYKLLQIISFEITVSLITSHTSQSRPRRVCDVTSGKVYARDDRAVAYTCSRLNVQKQINTKHLHQILTYNLTLYFCFTIHKLHKSPLNNQTSHDDCDGGGCGQLKYMRVYHMQELPGEIAYIQEREHQNDIKIIRKFQPGTR